MRDFDLVIVGAGAAGLTAAMFAGRRGLQVAVIDRMGAGGQIINAERIENLPGFPEGLGGYELGPLLQEQAEAAGAHVLMDEVVRFETQDGHHILTGSEDTLRAPAVIIAAGSSPRLLGIPGEEEYSGHGVSHCATCDGPFFRGQRVCVIGGGDSAVDEAIVLTEHVDAVTIVSRGEHLKAQQVLLDRLAASPKVTVIPQTIVESIEGNGSVSSVRLQSIVSQEAGQLEVSGVFVYVGLEPNSAFLQGFVDLDPAGHIETDIMMRTSLEGVFAAGDIRRHSVAQLTASAGDGATAAIAAFRYLRGLAPGVRSLEPTTAWRNH